MVLKEKLGKRIQELRIKNSLKQSELAEKVGIATKHQSCIETGKNYPSAELVEKYAKVFKIDVSVLFSLDYIKSDEELLSEINNMISSATSKELVLAYRILCGILR